MSEINEPAWKRGHRVLLKLSTAVGTKPDGTPIFGFGCIDGDDGSAFETLLRAVEMTRHARIAEDGNPFGIGSYVVVSVERHGRMRYAAATITMTATDAYDGDQDFEFVVLPESGDSSDFDDYHDAEVIEVATSRERAVQRAEFLRKAEASDDHE